MWQHSGECMCGLRNIALHYYQESVTTGQTHTPTDVRQTPEKSDHYVPLCFAIDTITNMYPTEIVITYITYMYSDDSLIQAPINSRTRSAGTDFRS